MVSLLRHCIVFIFLCILPVAVYARNIEVFVEDGDLGLPMEGAVVSLRGGDS
jgi:hypothetical protein